MLADCHVMFKALATVRCLLQLAGGGKGVDHDHDHENMVPDMVPDMVPGMVTRPALQIC